MTEGQDTHPARKSVLVIHNPVAGFWQRNRLKRFLTALRKADIRVAVRPTRAAGDGARLAAEIDPEQFDTVVAAGGDGTIREVASGLAGSPVMLGIMPLGTANVLALELALGTSPEAAADCVVNGVVTDIHQGLMDGETFLMMVSVGLDARVVARVTTKSKRLMSKGAYVLAAFAEVFTGQKGIRPVALVDGNKIEADLMIVSRISKYAGPFIIAPEADLRSRDLYIIAPQGRGLWNVIRYAAALITNRLASLPDVVVRRADEIELISPEGHPLQVDGDSLGNVPVRISCAEKPVRMIFPNRSR